MALWGNKETKNITGYITVTQNSNVVTGASTLFTTELKNGQVLMISSVHYRVASIVSDTRLFLATPYASSGSTGITSLKANEKPVSVLESDLSKVYGVDTTEAAVTPVAHAGWVKVTTGYGPVTSVTIGEAGSGYGATGPTITFSSGNATAGTNVVSGSVTSIVMNDKATYTVTAPTVSIAVAGATGFNTSSSVNASTEVITITSHPFFTPNPATYSSSGATGMSIGLANGTEYFVNKVSANTLKLYYTAADATTGGATGLLNLGATGIQEIHTLRGRGASGIVVMGGRFGRIKRETLVAMGVSSTVMGDAEDTQFPDS